MPIPGFNGSGLLPPFLFDPTLSAACSPYRTTTPELVTRFATSPERIAILAGFLDLRGKLRAFGLTQAFQWLDGSFVENIDGVRPPNDIDVVTFFHRPTGLKDPKVFSGEAAKRTDLFDPRRTKASFKSDAFFVDMDLAGATVVARTRYWFGLFSHRRTDFQWKGMLEVALDTDADDDAAAKQLNHKVIP